MEDHGPGPFEPRYLLVYRDGALVGAAVHWLWRHASGSATPDNLLLGRLQRPATRLGLSFLPALHCAPMRGHGGPHLLGAEPELVLATLEQVARNERLSLHVPRLMEADTDLVGILERRGYHLTLQDPVAVMNLPFKTYEEYVESLRAISKAAPSQVRTEMRRPGKLGIEVREITDAEPFATRLFELANIHNRRLNGTPVSYSPTLLPAIKARLGENCVLYGAFAQRELLGFTMGVRDGRTFNHIFIGLDDRLRRTCTYFVIAMYRPTADCIAAGIDRIYYGNLLYGVKRRRGCRILPEHFAYRASSPLRQAALAPWFATHRAWGQRRFASIVRQDGEASSATDGPDRGEM